MISSARQGCAKTVSYGLGRPSWSLALHAESSAQALLRAAAPRPSAPPRSLVRPPSRQAHSRARYSAAAAVIENDHIEDVEEDTPVHNRWRRSEAIARKNPPDKLTATSHRTFADPSRVTRREEVTPSEIPLVTFRSCLTTDPLTSLITIPSLSTEELWSIALVEFDVLVSSLSTVLRNPPLPNLPDPDDIHTALVKLHSAIRDHPQATASPQSLLGKRLRRFIKVCLLLGDEDLVRSVWRNTTKQLVAHGEATEGRKEKLADVDRMTQILAEDLRAWRMILWMFSPILFPDSALTPGAMERYLQAHLATHQPEAILALFHKHAELGLKPTPDSYNHLLQAMLALGNMDSARAAASRGRDEGGLTKATQQLAILRGHRALGAGIDLEKRVLGDLEKLGEEPTPGLINALIRLRINDGDYEGADRLLAQYGLGMEPGPSAQHHPTSDSIFLALKLAGRRKDLPRVRKLWTWLCRTPHEITDSHLSQLIAALDHEEGYNLISTLIDPSHPTQSSLSIPPFVKPGLRTLNALLASVSKRNPDLHIANRALALLPKLHIEPNAQTVKYILELLSKSGTPPEELATTLRVLLREFPAITPTISQINTILSASLSVPNSKLALPNLPTSAGPSSSPSAGMKPPDRLREALAPVISDLWKRNATSDSESLAIRLRFEALTHGKAGGHPSANVVWSNIIERGYRPNKRHVLALVSGYADSGAMREAQDVLQLAKDVDVKSTNGMWMALLTGWVRTGDLKQARAAYQKIESGPEGADIVAVSAMIQAYTELKAYDRGAEMVHKVLIPRFNETMDQKALCVAAHALRSNNEQIAALELVCRYRDDVRVMGAPIRGIAKEIGNWLEKMDEELRLKGKQGKASAREAREIQRGLEMRDWIMKSKTNSHKSHDSVRRNMMKSITGKTGLGVRSNLE